MLHTIEKVKLQERNEDFGLILWNIKMSEKYEEPEECPKFVDNEKILCFHGPRKIFNKDVFLKKAHF